MIEKFAGMKKQLSELALVLNEFKSEAVQLRLLELILGEESAEDAAEQQNKHKIPQSPRKKTKPTTGKVAGTVPSKRRAGSSGAGANATLSQLVSGNFFDKPRTINDIIEHCKHNLARTFKANEFSSKLGRLVRTQELTRKKNSDKQYEYSKP
jgi:hypothetical protein